MPDFNNPTGLSLLTRDIIHNREGVSEEFVLKKNKLESYLQNITKIESLEQNELWHVILNEAGISAQWNTIITDACNIKGEIQQALSNRGTFAGAYERATRKHVNLGAVGITREGKSTYVRKITGVDDWLVPNKGGDKPCTTAPINIINSSTPDGQNEVARVYYQTLKELVDFLIVWIEELGGGDAYGSSLKAVKTKTEFVEWCSQWPNIYNNPQFGNKQTISKQNFITYLKNANSYIDKILESDEQKTQSGIGYKDYKISDIQNHGDIAKDYYSSVCYYDSPVSNTVRYNSYATRLAEIYTNFSATENIQFLDTPGIGENKAGIEKTLSDAITMKLDIVIVIKAAYIANQDKASELFFSLLRERLTNHATAKDWVYYILNVHLDENGNYDFQQILDLRTRIKDNLRTPQQSSTIALEDIHFRFINLKEDCEYLSQTEIQTEHPIENYLSEILQLLIPKIKKIDEDFFSLGLSEYKKITAHIEHLCSKMSALSPKLPVFDDHTKIENLIVRLSEKFNTSKTYRHVIEGKLKPSVEEFKEEPIGTYVKKILGLSEDHTDLSELSIEAIDEFCKKNKDVIELRIGETSYENNKSFSDYSTVKGDLKKALIQGVLNQIKEKDAQEELAKIKNDFAEILETVGSLGFMVSAGSNDWWSDATAFLKKEKKVSELLSIFSGIRDMEIHAALDLGPSIIEAVRVSLNKDEFGEFSENWNFRSFDGALRCFIYSLLFLEASSKLDIEVSVFKRALEDIQKDINARFDRLWDLPKNIGDKSTESRNQLYSLYKRHLDEVFTNDAEAQKGALVDTYDGIVKEILQHS